MAKDSPKKRTDDEPIFVPSILDIDKFRLSDEWTQQPRLCFEWGEKLANARADLEYAKSNLDIVDADLDAAIRRDPAEYDLEKVTEAAVKSLVANDTKHIKAVHDVIDSGKRVGVLSAAVNSIDHRKRALEKLVDLLLADQYAKPIASEGAREHVEDSSRASTYRKTKVQTRRERGDDDDS